MEKEIQGDEDKQLEAELENMPTSDRKILKQITDKFKQGASGARRTANQVASASKAGLMMAKLTRYSQDANKLYWDNTRNAPKQNPDFIQALELNGRGMKLCDEIMAAWPAQMSSIMPLKEKLLAQKHDIELQSKGTIADSAALIAKAKSTGETNA